MNGLSNLAYEAKKKELNQFYVHISGKTYHLAPICQIHNRGQQVCWYSRFRDLLLQTLVFP